MTLNPSRQWIFALWLALLAGASVAQPSQQEMLQLLDQLDQLGRLASMGEWEPLV